MWKVELKKIHKLYEFTHIFLEDLFKWAIDRKGITLSEVQESIKEERLYCLAKECPSLREHMFKLASCDDIEEVFQMYIDFTGSYEYILKGNHKSSIKLKDKTFKTVKEAFEYFYKDTLDLKSFWSNYKSGEYKSKNEFREEIGVVRHRCPYCDINRSSVADFSNTDHFLPISNYPFLGITWKNLVVSCIPCNTTIKNKAISLPILHPFFDKIQDEIFFTFNMKSKVISINTRDNGFGNEAAENFYKLFNLEKNYPKLWDVIDREERDIIREISRYIKKNKITEFKVALLESNEIIDEREKDIYSEITIGECTKLKLDFYKFYREYNSSKLKKFILLEKKGKNAYKELEV